MKSVTNLIPKDKLDLEAVERLKCHSYEQIKVIVPELLEWIQDLNWPVAKPLAVFLESISEHLTEDILEILRGKDEVWKYWCIIVFGVNTSKPINEKLILEFSRIAKNPTKNEIEEEVNLVALEAINKQQKQNALDT